MAENEMIQLDEVLSELRKDAKTLAKDLIAGVGLFRAMWLLLLLMASVIGYFAFSYFLVFPLIQGGQCCYVLTWGDIGGGIFCLLTIPYVVWKAWGFRRRYISLQSKYRKLLELENILGK
jgi:hypothetical protein